jgi:hypothetical protein
MVGMAVAALLAGALAGPTKTHGTSYNPLTADECPGAAGSAPGAAVFLFHGGSEAARSLIRAGEVLTVSRPGGNGRWETVGLVRADAAAGAHCVRCEVVEGELRLYDVAQAAHGVFLLIATDAPCLAETHR